MPSQKKCYAILWYMHVEEILRHLTPSYAAPAGQLTESTSSLPSSSSADGGASCPRCAGLVDHVGVADGDIQM